MTTGTVQSFTYDELMAWANINAQSVNYNLQEWFDIASSYGVGEEQALIDYIDGFGGSSGLKVIKAADGTYTGYFYDGVEQYVSTSPINSNISTVSRGNLKQMVGQKFTDVQGTLTRQMVTKPASGGLGANAAYFLGSAASSWFAVSTGIALGKAIDSTLYNANPAYWDSIGLSTLNPETWNGMINNDDSPFAGLFNFILGIDPDTGQSQAYIPEDAFAYFAYALAQNGWFAPDSTYFVPPASFDTIVTTTNPVCRGWSGNSVLTVSGTTSGGSAATVLYGIDSYTGTVRFGPLNPGENGGATYTCLYVSDVSQTITTYYEAYINGVSRGHNAFGTRLTSTYTYDGKTVYYGLFLNGSIGTSLSNMSGNLDPITNTALAWNNLTAAQRGQYAWTLCYGAVEASPIPGVAEQTGATLPDTSTWSNIPNTLTSLQNQYPSTVGAPLVWDMYNDDGTTNQTRWVPIPIPDFISDTDPNPTSGDQIQSSLYIDQMPKTLQDLITKIIQLIEPTPQPEPSPEPSPQPEPSPNPPIPPNPTPTGDGETPPIPTVTGEASALWSVYNPTQAQVDSFGAWLWSSPFVTNILKLFQNPIEGVISLHKIFATPVTGDSANIVVGTLDSNVSSVTVTDQYTYVDCGTVDLYEQFGNVFDYSPFTEVSLYLPFIGIVTLDVADIMRSTIHISYGVDVYTGTCLAMVEVTRDACTVNMYQYSGVCSVEYPLSNVQNSQMLSGILSVAAGVATVATAGAAGAGVSALMGTAGGLAAMGKQHVGRSGGFSGNAGAMGIKKPYLIIQRPQTKVADTFPSLVGYPTNVSGLLSDFSGQVRVTDVHVEGIPATDSELTQIEEMLKSGILI